MNANGKWIEAVPIEGTFVLKYVQLLYVLRALT